MSSMSLVFSDVNGVSCDVHPDWLGFSVTDYNFQGELDPIFEHLPLMTYIEGGRHHNHMYQGDGVTICYDAKLTTKDGKLRQFTNYNLEIELTGKYFCDYDCYELFKAIFSAGGKVRFFRVDAALDYYGAVEYRMPVITHDGTFREIIERLKPTDITGHNLPVIVKVGNVEFSKRWEGYKFGANERVVRLYDKAYEQKSKDLHQKWWRYEIVLRGDKCRDAFGYDHRQFTADEFMLTLCDVLSNKSVSAYDEQFADLAAKISNREIITRNRSKPKYDNAEINLIDVIKTKIKKFQHLWRKNPLSAKVHNVVSAMLKAPENPPMLLGGSSI